MITGIVIALPDEINSLTSKKINKGDCVFISDSILVSCSGAGSKNATLASQKLIDKGAKKLISWGCAGALSSELNSGDLILPAQLKSADNQPLATNPLWFSQVIKQLSALNPTIGILAESTSIVAESQAKQALNKKTYAIAVDMESVAVVQIAKQHKLPALVIRCIADPVEMSLPKSVSYALNDQGDVELPKLLWFLLTHPTELPGLIKLGIHFKAAKNKLKLVAEHIDTITRFDPQATRK